MEDVEECNVSTYSFKLLTKVKEGQQLLKKIYMILTGFIVLIQNNHCLRKCMLKVKMCFYKPMFSFNSVF